VCPREAEAHLRHRYDRVIALERPLVRRSLRWHYDTFA
jgi:predicted phosphoribosyltransferase